MRFSDAARPQVVACVPVVVDGQYTQAFLDAATYSTYEKVQCPWCGAAMWLGERAKALLARDPSVKMACMFCLAEAMVRSSTPVDALEIRKLTDTDQ